MPNVAGRCSRVVRPVRRVDCDGQEGAVADPGHGAREEALPGALDERVGAEADGEEAERDRQHQPAADPVDEGAGDRAGDEAHAGVGGEYEPGHAEPDPLLVVQVDEQERQHEPVPERVHQAPDLEELHCTRQARVQAREGTPHA